MSDEATPPETAAACADLFAAIERFDMLGLLARGLYEKFHGCPRYVPMLEGVTSDFMRSTGATLDRYGPQIIKLCDREKDYDELHSVVVACMRELTVPLAPHFPAESLGALEAQFWGVKLKRWPVQVRELHLPAADREYLSSVGLPMDVGWSLRIEPPAPGGTPTLAKGMVVLAHDNAMTIAADADGRVWALEGESKRFVNCSTSAFGRCLIAYEWYRRSADDVDRSQAIAIVLKVIALTDSEALAKDEHYWAMIVERIREGT